MNNINLTEVLEFYGNSKESVLEVFQEFLNSHEIICNELKESFESGEVKKFKGALHHNTPMFTYIGLSSLTNQLSALEKKCENITNVDELKDEFYENYELVMEAKSLVSLKKDELIDSN
jgi:hypothetical protein